MSDKTCVIDLDYIISTIRSNLDETPFESARRLTKYSLDIEAGMILSISNSFKNSHFCKGLGAYMVFDGTIYRKVNKDLITAIIKSIMDTKCIHDRYLVSTPDKAFNCISNTIGLTQFTPTRSIVSFRNGMMDMENGFTFQEPSPEFYTSIYIDTAYDPDAVCPRFDKFLKEILPAEDDRMLIQDIFGYMFVNRKTVKVEKIAMFLGEGRNGKSVLCDVINGVVGSDNISGFSLYDLIDHPQADYKVAACDGKLLNYCPDADKKDVTGGRYKSIISGEKVSARHPHERSFEAENIPPMVMNVNDIPITSDQSFGYYRRQLIVKFGVTIADEDVDTSLAKKILDEEKSGILNWILDGTKRVLENGDLTISQSSIDATMEARNNGSTILQYLIENGYTWKGTGKALFKNITDIYTEYKNFCMECNNKAMSRLNFKKQMEREKFSFRKRKEGWGFEYYLIPDNTPIESVEVNTENTGTDNSGEEQLPF